MAKQCQFSRRECSRMIQTSTSRCRWKGSWLWLRKGQWGFRLRLCQMDCNRTTLFGSALQEVDCHRVTWHIFDDFGKSWWGRNTWKHRQKNPYQGWRKLHICMGWSGRCRGCSWSQPRTLRLNLDPCRFSSSWYSPQYARQSRIRKRKLLTFKLNSIDDSRYSRKRAGQLPPG